MIFCHHCLERPNIVSHGAKFKFWPDANSEEEHSFTRVDFRLEVNERGMAVLKDIAICRICYSKTTTKGATKISRYIAVLR